MRTKVRNKINTQIKEPHLKKDSQYRQDMVGTAGGVKRRSLMDYYTWIHQYWPTSKNFYSGMCGLIFSYIWTLDAV